MASIDAFVKEVEKWQSDNKINLCLICEGFLQTEVMLASESQATVCIHCPHCGANAYLGSIAHPKQTSELCTGMEVHNLLLLEFVLAITNSPTLSFAQQGALILYSYRRVAKLCRIAANHTHANIRLLATKKCSYFNQITRKSLYWLNFRPREIAKKIPLEAMWENGSWVFSLKNEDSNIEDYNEEHEVAFNTNKDGKVVHLLDALESQKDFMSIESILTTWRDEWGLDFCPICEEGWLVFVYTEDKQENGQTIRDVCLQCENPFCGLTVSVWQGPSDEIPDYEKLPDDVGIFFFVAFGVYILNDLLEKDIPPALREMYRQACLYGYRVSQIQEILKTQLENISENRRFLAKNCLSIHPSKLYIENQTVQTKTNTSTHTPKKISASIKNNVVELRGKSKQ